MKKVNKLLMLSVALLMGIGLVGCSSSSEGTKTETPEETNQNQNSGEPSDTPVDHNQGGQVGGEDIVIVNMSDSYRTGRERFKKVTGVELPALENLEADAYPYHEGDQEYCFDIIDGSALNYTTYLVFENFFLGKLGTPEEGYPSGNEKDGRDCQWIVSGRWYQTMWDAYNSAIYINTTTRSE